MLENQAKWFNIALNRIMSFLQKSSWLSIGLPWNLYHNGQWIQLFQKMEEEIKLFLIILILQPIDLHKDE